MLCEKCGSKLTPGAMKCDHCGKKLDHPATGEVENTAYLPEATLRIIPKKKPSFWYWINHLSNMRILTGKINQYTIYLYVDDVEYVFESNVGQYDVKVTPGVHSIWFGTKRLHKNLRNAASKIGENVAILGKLTGSANTTLVSEALMANKVEDSDYLYYDFDPGEVKTCRIRMNASGFGMEEDI